MPAKIYRNNLIKGIIIVPNNEKGVISPINIMIINTLGPWIWSFHANSELYLDIMPPNICDPSSGDIGIRLNIARAILIKVKKYKAWIIDESEIKL